MPRIHANRESVDDRFSVLGFTIRTESPLYEVAVATDPILFRSDSKAKRGRRNFFSSRSQGALRARRGEAVYLLPQDVLANFVGQPKLYFGLATYREGSTSRPDYVQVPNEGNMWVGLTGLTERGLRRAVSSLSPSSYGGGSGQDASLEWGGDAIPAQANTPARAVAAAPAAAPSVAAALDYDDGYGELSAPVATPSAPEVPVLAQEVILRAYDGDLASQLRLFGETVQWVAGVNDTSRLPHSAICQVLCYNGDRLLGKGTAFFVGRRTLLTNGHVVAGCTSMVIIPGKNGASTDSSSEPFGRFTVTQWQAHENYLRGSLAGRRHFDMAVVRATRDAPHGVWLSPVEELTQSRPEGVAVCGYSARSRRDDVVGSIVNATLNPDKQHVHRGFVRELSGDSSSELFYYDVQELAGSSGSPVYWIEAGRVPRVHVVGINAAPHNATTNLGVRLTSAKVAWIRARAAEFGESLALEADGQQDYPTEQSLGDADDASHGIGGAQPDSMASGAQSSWAESLTTPTPQYPLARRFVQAASGNYRHANRSRADIQRIVIHITDGCTTGHCRTDAERNRAINGTISWFQDPASQVSAHYIVGQDGEVVQMVRHEDVAYHAHTANTNSIGIEHVADAGHTGHVRTNPTRLQLDASAALVTWLCDQFGITPDRSHILGHSEVDTATSHADCPNAVWDWPTYMQRVTSRQCLAQALETLAGGTRGGTAPSVSAGLLAPAPAPVLQQPLGLEAGPPGPQPMESTVPGASMVRVLLRHGESESQLEQLRGYKHPHNQVAGTPAAFQDATPIRLSDWPRIESANQEAVCIAYEVRWQHNGTALGNVQINHVRSQHSSGWRLRVTARIFDDPVVYPAERPQFAALRLRFEYCFSPSSGPDVLAFQELHLFGNGRYNQGGDWAQYHALPLEMDGGVEPADERLDSATPSAPIAQALDVVARSATPTTPSRYLARALAATTGVRHAVLQAGAAELGVREVANPGFRGANTHTGDPTLNSDAEGRIVAYLQACGVAATQGANNPAYCAAFTTFALRSGGYAGVRGSAGAGALRAQFEQAGRYHAVDQQRPYDPSRDFRPGAGDVFFTGSVGHESHAGLVVACDDNGTLHTLEGNTWGPVETNAGVMERDHAAARGGKRFALVGFGSLVDDAPRTQALDAAPAPSGLALSWESASHPERADWSRQLIASVTEHKAALDQARPEAYLPGYNTLDAARQIKFWCELMIAMAQFESGWNPRSRYQESNGEYSVGLFQLSYGNARAYHWEPVSEERASLEDPLVNIRCAAIVLSHLVAQDQVVASSEPQHRGGARYWSVLRAGPRHKFNDIRAYVRAHVPMP